MSGAACAAAKKVLCRTMANAVIQCFTDEINKTNVDIEVDIRRLEFITEQLKHVFLKMPELK